MQTNFAAASHPGSLRHSLSEPAWPTPVGQVSALFWPLALMALAAALLARHGGWAIDGGPVLLVATAVMLIGGLPHGACDMALAAAAWRIHWHGLVLVLAAYLGVGALMMALWWAVPVAALLLFLALAGLHFGEDWTMLPRGLLRIMAGLAVITTAALGQPGPVGALFSVMTQSPLAVPIAHWAAAAAPVTLLVTLVGLILAWRAGHREWVLAQTICYGCLLTLPPLIGFSVFFVGLHSPLHWRQVVHTLPRQWRGAALWQGVWLTALVLAVWIWALWYRGLGVMTPAMPLFIGGDAFRLLAIVAAPHLVLSLAIERRLGSARIVTQSAEPIRVPRD